MSPNYNNQIRLSLTIISTFLLSINYTVNAQNRDDQHLIDNLVFQQAHKEILPC